MKCEKNMQEMLAAWLNGELGPAEAEGFEKHLGECASCREDLAVWNEIRDALRREPVEMAPPEGFAAGVMARIPERRAGWWETVTSNFRRGLAAAAASLLIALGGMGATIYYSIMPGAQVVDNGGQNQPAIAENGGGGSNLPQAGNGNTPPGTINPGEPVSNREDGGETKQPGSENTIRTTGEEGVLPANSGETARSTEMLALLNVEKERVIYTTLLRVRAYDPDGVETAVAGLAGKHKADYRLMESQNTAAGKRLAFEVLVERDSAGGLLRDLEELGQVMNRETDRKDISGLYNEQVEQYQSLYAQLQTAGSEEEKQLLTSKMNAIEKQLRAWETESGMHKVVFWVES